MAKVHVDIGQKVRGPRFDANGRETEPGQLLAEVDVPEMEEEARQKAAVVRQAEAEIEQARKSQASAEAGVRVAEAAVTEAKAGLAKFQANFDRWESESRRITGLVRTGVMDRQTGEETENQFKSAQAGREEAVARVASAEAMAHRSRAERDKAESDVTADEARLDVCRAEVRRHAAMLRYAKVRAPFDGVVTRRTVDTGHFLQANRMEPIFVVARADRVRVAVDVPEADAALVKAGLKATVVIPSLKGLNFEGVVSRTAWGLDDGSRTLRTEIDFDNADGRLRPGMFVSARITAPLPEAFVVPPAAVTKQGDVTVCFVIYEGKAARTPVRTGVTAGEWTQVFQWKKSEMEWKDFDGTETLASPAAVLADGQAVNVGTAVK